MGILRSWKFFILTILWLLVTGIIPATIAFFTPRDTIIQGAKDRSEEMQWFIELCHRWTYSIWPWIVMAAWLAVYFVCWRIHRSIAKHSSQKKERRLVEKHRATEHWRNRIDELIASAPKSARSKNIIQDWCDEVIDAFNNLLVMPKEKIDRFTKLTSSQQSGDNIMAAIQRGIQFLRDIRDTVTEGELS